MNNISPKCAVELLEVIKYFDKELQENITPELINYLNSIKDDSYYFEINKNVPLYDNDFMEETIKVLNEIIGK